MDTDEIVLLLNYALSHKEVSNSGHHNMYGVVKLPYSLNINPYGPLDIRHPTDCLVVMVRETIPDPARN
jgi:hypothetical protein